MIKLMLKNSLPAIMILLVLFLAGGCKTKTYSSITDSPTTGTINISVDESFKPVIDELIKVYEGSYPGTKIIAHYKPEAECMKDLLRDSLTRMVIITRGLTRKESRYFEDLINYVPSSYKIAVDAIAVVVNAKSQDTVFSIDRLQQQLSGGMGYKQQIIFDGLSATSTVRFAIDSILKGKQFDTGVVRAVKNSRQVLDYVAENENAIGIVGNSWIGNPEDTAQLAMLKRVKLGFVKCETCSDSPYVKPSQFSIMSKRYPLVRGLYYILKENYNGLGSGFVNFMKYERGQLIFRRAYLWPGIIDFNVRTVKINEKLEKD
jgi:phosphate transport system substrate-binding protein